MNHTIALIILILVGMIFGYFSGSVLYSVIIGKVFFHKDPRNFESKNAGATNSSRLFGKKVGGLVLALDILKCLIPTYTMWMIAKFALNDYLNHTYYFSENSLIFLTAFSGLVGHCFPIFFKFKGGKAASSLGTLIVCVSPFAGLLSLILWILIIKKSKFVSLGSVITASILPFFVFIPGLDYMYMVDQNIQNVFLIHQGNQIYTILLSFGLLLISALLLVYKHRDNIIRLINKQERKVLSN